MTLAKKPERATPLMRAVRELRYIYRLSQRAFADFLGVPRGRVATVETGWSNPSDAYLQPYARYAGVSADELRQGMIALERCASCKGSGVKIGKSRTVKHIRDRKHPKTPTIPAGS